MPPQQHSPPVPARGDDINTNITRPLTSLADVAGLLSAASSIVVLTGAGISVSCGIPDFRSRGGLYDAVRDKYGLADPEIVFDLHQFLDDPSVFYSFAKHVMPPPSLSPSSTHYFIAQLAERSKLLRVYSQNIDGLESRAGVPDNRLVLCHGSFLSATCTHRDCHATVTASHIVDHVMSGDVPHCQTCLQRHETKMRKRRKLSGKIKRKTSFADYYDSNDEDEPDIGVLKPDIIFFGEKLPSHVSASINRDIRKADLVLVIGTSLTVEPVASLPHHFEKSVPRILINQQPIKPNFDVELIGDCDIIIHHVTDELGWHHMHASRASSTGSAAVDNCRAADTLQQNVSPESDEIASRGQLEHKSVKFIPPKRFLFKGGDLSEV